MMSLAELDSIKRRCKNALLFLVSTIPTGESPNDFNPDR